MTDSSQEGQIQFHDLVDLINAKIAEITEAAGGEKTGRDTNAINSLYEARAIVIRICEDDECPSYVFRC